MLRIATSGCGRRAHRVGEGQRPARAAGLVIAGQRRHLRAVEADADRLPLVQRQRLTSAMIAPPLLRIGSTSIGLADRTPATPCRRDGTTPPASARRRRTSGAGRRCRVAPRRMAALSAAAPAAGGGLLRPAARPAGCRLRTCRGAALGTSFAGGLAASAVRRSARLSARRPSRRFASPASLRLGFARASARAVARHGLGSGLDLDLGLPGDRLGGSAALSRGASAACGLSAGCGRGSRARGLASPERLRAGGVRCGGRAPAHASAAPRRLSPPAGRRRR